MLLDDVDKTQRLMAALEAAVPIEAILAPQLRRDLSAKDPALPSSGRCTVDRVAYLGDLGGIMCHLGFGFDKPGPPHVISITHLIFRANTPHYREIDAYQRHRVKKLKKYQGGLYEGTEVFDLRPREL